MHRSEIEMENAHEASLHMASMRRDLAEMGVHTDPDGNPTELPSESASNNAQEINYDVDARTEATEMTRSVNDLWTKCSNKEYCTEASDLDGNRDWNPRNKCPNCHCRYGNRDLVRVIYVGSDEDREVGGWEFQCGCGAKLTVFND